MVPAYNEAGMLSKCRIESVDAVAGNRMGEKPECTDFQFSIKQLKMQSRARLSLGVCGFPKGLGGDCDRRQLKLHHDAFSRVFSGALPIPPEER